LSLSDLYSLQELDLVRAEKQQALDEVRAEIGDESDLQRARQRLAQLDARHSRQEALRREAQRLTDDIETREGAVQNRLYSGAVTNPRELEAIQEEQALLSRQKAEAEDTLLEHMVAAEELQDALTRTQEAVTVLDERRIQRLPHLRQQEQALSAEVDALDQRRAGMLPQIPPQMLSTYETLRVSRGGQSVSKIEQSRGMDICGVCRVALPRSDTEKLRSGDSLVLCNNCRRILYME